MNYPDAARYMYREAMDYLNDARILGDNIHSCSSGGALLSILCFEILLKATYRLCLRAEAPKNHNYVLIWKSLDSKTRTKILAQAHERFAGHIDLVDPDLVLTDLSEAFVKARYSYEPNVARSRAQISKVSSDWVEGGCDLSTADFVYRPTECAGLIYGCCKLLEDRLGVSCGLAP